MLTIQYKQCPGTEDRPGSLTEAFVVRRVLSEMNAFNVITVTFLHPGCTLDYAAK